MKKIKSTVRLSYRISISAVVMKLFALVILIITLVAVYKLNKMDYQFDLQHYTFALAGFKYVIIAYLIGAVLQYIDNYLQLKQYKLLEQQEPQLNEEKES